MYLRPFLLYCCHYFLVDIFQPFFKQFSGPVFHQVINSAQLIFILSQSQSSKLLLGRPYYQLLPSFRHPAPLTILPNQLGTLFLVFRPAAKPYAPILNLYALVLVLRLSHANALSLVWQCFIISLPPPLSIVLVIVY